MAKNKTAGRHGLTFTADAAELQKVLSRVQAGIVRKAQIPILLNVLIEADPDLGVSFYTTNLDQQAETGLGADVADVTAGGATTVDAAMLHNLVGKMKGEVTLSMTGEHRLGIFCGKAKAELPTLPAADFTKLGSIDDAVSFEIAGGMLASGLNSVSHAVSSEETRYYLNGVLMEHRGGQLLFTATDGHRLAHIAVTASGHELAPFEPVIVPRWALAPLVKLAGLGTDPVVLSIGQSMMQLTAGRDAFRVKLVDGTFPDYGRVIPKPPFKFTQTVPVAEAREAVNLAIAATTEKSNAVKLTGADGKLTAHVQQDGKWVEAFMEHPDIVDAAPIGVNGKYLVAALDRVSSSEISLNYSDGQSPMLLQREGDALVQVIMPLRV